MEYLTGAWKMVIEMVRTGMMSVILSLGLAASASALQGDGTGTSEPGWNAAGRLEEGRAGLGVAVLDGKLYAAGGSGLTTPHVEFDQYDPDYDDWIPELSLPVGLERFGMAAIEGRIYVAGGYAGGGYTPEETGFQPYGQTRQAYSAPTSPSASMWSWSPEDGIWQSEAALPGPRVDFDLISLNERLYAIGGQRDDETLYVFDPVETSWSSESLPAGVIRQGAVSVVFAGELWVMGGMTDGDVTRRTDVFSPQSGEWRTGPDLPEAVVGASAASFQGRLHLMGGRGSDNETTLDTHWAYDGERAVWGRVGTLLAPRTEAAAAVVGDGIYLVGGGSGGGFFAPFTALNDTDVYTELAE